MAYLCSERCAGYPGAYSGSLGEDSSKTGNVPDNGKSTRKAKLYRIGGKAEIPYFYKAMLPRSYADALGCWIHITFADSQHHGD